MELHFWQCHGGLALSYGVSVHKFSVIFSIIQSLPLGMYIGHGSAEVGVLAVAVIEKHLGEYLICV